MGSSSAATSIGHTQPSAWTKLVEVSSGKARLHQIPVAEQHGVGDRAQERGAGKRAQERHGKVAAGVDGGGDQPDDADDRREQVDDGWELPPGRAASLDLALDAGHLGDPLRPPVVLLGLSRDSGVPVDDRDASANAAARTTAAALISRTQTTPNRAPSTRAERPSPSRCHEAAIHSRCPTSRRRVVNHRKASPPTAHCSSTVAASRRITPGRLTSRGISERSLTRVMDLQKFFQLRTFSLRQRVNSVQLNKWTDSKEPVHHRVSPAGAGSHFVDAHPSRNSMKHRPPRDAGAAGELQCEPSRPPSRPRGFVIFRRKRTLARQCDAYIRGDAKFERRPSRCSSSSEDASRVSGRRSPPNHSRQGRPAATRRSTRCSARFDAVNEGPTRRTTRC